MIEGEPLFDADGGPAPALQRALSFLERFEAEAQRTRQFCARLLELGSAQAHAGRCHAARRPDASASRASRWSTRSKLHALPEAAVLELHRNGMLMLIHLHVASLATMRHLIERKARARTAPTRSPAMDRSDDFERGVKNRRAVLGDEWVDQSLGGTTQFNADFQDLVTRHAWLDIWGRPGLDVVTRRLLVLGMTMAAARWEEFELHCRASVRAGVTHREDPRRR